MSSGKIALLGSHPVCLPAVMNLIRGGEVCGLATGETSPLDPVFRELARQSGIPCQKLHESKFGPQLAEFLDVVQADTVFVLTFPWIIEAEILKIPRRGFLNFHTGLLPIYRGIEPIFWQIRQREEWGGVSVHQMTEVADAGAILHVEKIKLSENETYGTHLQRLAPALEIAARRTVEKLAGDDSLFEEQAKFNGPACVRPNQGDLTLNWQTDSAAALEALVRASNPNYGGAISFIKKFPWRVFQARVLLDAELSPGTPGGIITRAQAGKELTVSTRDGKELRLEILQSEWGVFDGGRLVELLDLEVGERIFADLH